MTYSCARFDDAADAVDESLADAQCRKIDALLDATGVGLGTPGARDRHRLGHARGARRAARCDRHHR